jgi:cytochrome c biogenesis protein CcdA/glutaredoxin/thiol-disulfide isomerase/thioredoxin
MAAGLFLPQNNGKKVSAESERHHTLIYFFWGEGCPHCQLEKDFLVSMEEKYAEVEVKSFETWSNKENVRLFHQVAQNYGVKAGGVPVTFISDFDPIIGFGEELKPDIENKIINCLETGCIDPGQKAGLSSDQVARAQKLDGSQINHKKDKPCLHLFYKDDCSQCKNIKEYIDSLERDYDIEINKYEISSEPEKEIYQTFKEKYGLTTGAYPIVFIGDKYFIGDDAIRHNLKEEVVYCQNNPCTCPVGNIKGFTPYLPQSRSVTPETQETIQVPFFGKTDLSTLSAYTSTAIIAFVDGFNPCSLWLITFLLGIVIHSNSRKKILAVGGTFLLVTGLVYALFMAGLLNIFLYVSYLGWIHVIVAGVALIFAVVNIKDYFWYKKGISFTVSDKYKPRIFKNIRGVMKPNKTLAATIIGTTILALGVVLVELPCTAGFPLIWTNMIAQQQIHGLAFLALLAVYMIIYLLDELVVVGIAFWTMKLTRFEEKHGRILKLIGGMIMLALALTMIFDPDLMNQVSSAILIFAAAITASFLVMLIHRRVLPRFNILVGTEKDLSGEKAEITGEKE